MYNPSAEKSYFDEKAHESKSLESPWKDLRHSLGRLDAFRRAAAGITESSTHWPHLFSEFKIRMLQSYQKDNTPFPGKIREPSEMIGSMTSIPERKHKLLEAVSLMESHSDMLSLASRIKKTCISDKFTPEAHAEMIVLDWLEKSEGTLPTRFFGRYRYIGSSKPTCRLCHYYFADHDSGVSVRNTHHNIYVNWKIPDVFESQHSSAVERQKKQVLSIIERLRKDIFRALEHQIAERKKHDSNTDSHTFQSRMPASWMNSLGTLTEKDINPSENEALFSDHSIEGEIPSFSETPSILEEESLPPSKFLESKTSDLGDIFVDFDSEDDNGEPAGGRL